MQTLLRPFNDITPFLTWCRLSWTGCSWPLCMPTWTWLTPPLGGLQGPSPVSCSALRAQQAGFHGTACCQRRCTSQALSMPVSLGYYCQVGMGRLASDRVTTVVLAVLDTCVHEHAERCKVHAERWKWRQVWDAYCSVATRRSSNQSSYSLEGHDLPRLLPMILVFLPGLKCAG
jgi:hypothetical protein